MGEADANGTSGELGSAFQGALSVNLYLGLQSWKY